MIMFFLPWWTYVLIATIAFTSSYGGVWLANIAEPGIRQDDEPYPCLFHVVTSSTVSWCWLEHGHRGEHVAMAQEWPDEDIDVTTFSDAEDVILSTPEEWDGGPNEEIDPLPPLPQRQSKVPTWCDETGSNGLGCTRDYGHVGLCSY